MSKKKFASLFAMLLIVLVAMACAIGFAACSGGDEDASEHDHQVTWTLADDGETATVTITCSVKKCSEAGDHTVFATAGTPVDPTCVDDGYTPYTATYTDGITGETYNGEMQVAGDPATGHTVVYTWKWANTEVGDPDVSAAYVEMCSVCGEEFSSVSADVKYDATDTTYEHGSYTATIEGTEYTDTVEAVVDIEDGTIYHVDFEEWADELDEDLTGDSNIAGETVAKTYKSDIVLLDRNGITLTALATGEGSNDYLQIRGMDEPKTTDSDDPDAPKYYKTLKLCASNNGDGFTNSILIETEGPVEITFTVWAPNLVRSNYTTRQLYVYEFINGSQSSPVVDVLLAYGETYNGDPDLTVWTVILPEAGKYYMTANGALDVYAVDVHYITEDYIVNDWAGDVTIKIGGDFSFLTDSLDESISGLLGMLGIDLSNMSVNVGATASITADAEGNFTLTLSDFSCSTAYIGDYVVRILESAIGESLVLTGTWVLTGDEYGIFVANTEYGISATIEIKDDLLDYSGYGGLEMKVSLGFTVEYQDTEISFVIDEAAVTTD